MAKRSVFGGWSLNYNSDLWYPIKGQAIAPNNAPRHQWMLWMDWIASYNNGEPTMRTLTIELRFDSDVEDHHKVLQEAAKAAAKHLWTNALLISMKRAPQIAMFTSDMFAGQEEISLADDIE